MSGQSEPREPLQFTATQGQYLAYIHTYTVLHGRPPAESDLRAFFRATPPSIHDMIKRLAARGLVSRIPRQARTLKVLLDPARLPPLDPRD